MLGYKPSGDLWCRFCGGLVGTGKRDYAELRCAMCAYFIGVEAQEIARLESSNDDV